MEWKKGDKREIQRNADAESSFEYVKEAMAIMTLLYHPSQDAELAFLTDCGNFAVAGMLKEIITFVQKPVKSSKLHFQTSSPSTSSKNVLK